MACVFDFLLGLLGLNPRHFNLDQYICITLLAASSLQLVISHTSFTAQLHAPLVSTQQRLDMLSTPDQRTSTLL